VSRTGRYLFRGALLAAGGWAAWSFVNWIAAPNTDEPMGACARSGLPCALCTTVGRSDCYERPLVGCPGSVVEYVSSFAQYKAKLAQQKTAVVAWTGFRREMEATQNKSSIELCRANLEEMRKIEAQIPVSQACPGETDKSPRPDAAGSGDEVAMLSRFRNCSEAKAKELGAEIKQRTSLQVGEETGQLHSLLKEVTRVTTESIELLTEFREQANEARQVKCWLRGRIRDCGR
jgi:hypothetical protein